MAIDNYKEKLEFLCIKQNWTCPICKQKMNYGQNLNFHHAGIENTKHAQKTYPLFLDSVLNGIILHQDCHINHGTGYGKMKESDILDIEAFLKFIEAGVKSGSMIQKVKNDKIVLVLTNDKFVEYSKLRSQISDIEKCSFENIGFAIRQIWERLGK